MGKEYKEGRPLRTVFMYNKKHVLLRLRMSGLEVVDIEKIYKKDFLPISLSRSLTIENLNSWIQKRLIPNSREGIKEARNLFPHFENYNCMFSLSDQYWFRYKKEQTWESLNFFTNDFSSDVGNVFFSPWDVDPSSAGDPSPDLTTNGILKKTWRKEGGVNFLYKAASADGRQQPISEILSSLIFKNLNFIPFVEYELDIYGLKMCSKCQNFINEMTEFVPASHIYYLEPRPEGVSYYQHFLNMCKPFNIPNLKEHLDRMIAADFIIGNKDRHFGNFGFIRNVYDGHILSMAPIFDSGLSFLTVEKESKAEKIFESERMRALLSVMQTYDLKKAINCDQMFNLIDKYPELSKKTKAEMKTKILEASENLTRLYDEASKQLQNPKVGTTISDFEASDVTETI